MEATNEIITLSGADTFVPQNEKDVFLVLSGTVLVFVQCRKSTAHTKKLLLCEVPRGKLIPAFVYRDADYNSWRFSFQAQGDAQLQRMENAVTSVLLRKFASYAKLQSFETEGFHQSIVDFYNRDELKAGVFVKRMDIQDPVDQDRPYEEIKNVFTPQTEYGHGDDPVYQAVAFAGKKLSVPVVAFDKLSGYGLEEITVPAVARASGFGCRSIVLEPEWYKADCGIIISNIEGKPVSCVPHGRESYDIFDSETGQVRLLTPEMANTVDPCAWVIYRTLPEKKLTPRDLVRFGWKCINRFDLASVAGLALVTALVGVLLPTLNQQIYDEYIPLGNSGQLIQLCVVIGAFMIGNLLFEMVKNLSESRLGSRVGYDFQNAVYYRIFHLPESFFRKFDSADLAQRLGSAETIGTTLVNTVVISGISSLFSLIYLVRMFRYSTKLAWLGVGMILAYAALGYFLSTKTIRSAGKIEDDSGRASAKLYQFLNGIEKLRMAGAEDQAIYEYLVPFSAVQKEAIRKNRIDGIMGTLSCVISTIFSMVLYYALVNSGNTISLGSFIGFNTAFGTFSSGVMGLVGSALQIYQLRPVYRRIKPILETAQEDERNGELLTELSGEVSLEHVCFSYSKNSPDVINNLSLHIRPGEYVGIVGPSGCGKSTLLKLLLGFEKPKSGQVCYDGKDLNALNKRQLRKHVGVVLQNGKLISGSIYENITITSPQATMAQVNAVVEAVGLKDDIAQMPMGLHTMLSENAGTISGGQQQRILIARAIISRPSLLIFDEATSALDNLTQAAVCESLDKMKVTRIVVAHRLSTIKSCDRILVLHGGGIAEEGNYQELMDRKGLFYQLACRQIAD